MKHPKVNQKEVNVAISHAPVAAAAAEERWGAGGGRSGTPSGGQAASGAPVTGQQEDRLLEGLGFPQLSLHGGGGGRNTVK